MPKSSSARRTPRPRSWAKVVAPRIASRSTALSVSSSTRWCGGRPGVLEHGLDAADQVGVLQLDGRDVDLHGEVARRSRPWSSQARASQQARWSTNWPSALISPVSSASGMNSDGQHGPRAGAVPADERLDRGRRGRRRGRRSAGSRRGRTRCSTARWSSACRPWRSRTAARMLGLEEHVAVLAGALGVVHRDVGVADDRVGVVDARGAPVAMPIVTETRSCWWAASAGRSNAADDPLGHRASGVLGRCRRAG